jgi:formylglycine-generating enzyme required for sulfatase activity
MGQVSSNPLNNEAREDLHLQICEFETVTVDADGQVIQREKNKASYFVELLDKTEGQSATLGIEMMAIPGGSFEMGSPENKPESHGWTVPQHTVTVQSFFMGKYTITQAQWRFVAQLPQINQELDPDPCYHKGDNLPVVSVTWYDAIEFCDRLSKYTGKKEPLLWVHQKMRKIAVTMKNPNIR